MLTDQPLVDPNTVFDKKLLTHSLHSIGSYVYGYYRPNETEPFYVGKGQGNRVLMHWLNAIDGNNKHSQYEEIRRILTRGKIPAVKILAENLQNTMGGDVYGVVERVLQNTFGIERADDKVFSSRIKKRDPALVQYRNDGKLFPVMSLEAIYLRETYAKASISTPQIMATECDAPLLLVGLSSSYSPSYSQADLCEMARMYWDLDRKKKLSILKESSAAVLASWVSDFGGPQISGVWRIRKDSFKYSTGKHSKRYICEAEDDFPLRKKLLGRRLEGTGHNYQGPNIYLPEV